MMSNFEVGDLIKNQDGNYRVILGVKDGQYKYMNLQEEYINSQPPITVKKGDISFQPCSIVDKYHFLYQLRG